MIPPETMRRYSVLADLESEFLGELSAICHETTAEKDEWLFHEGDSADALYLITRGSVELKLRLDEKRNIHVRVTTLHEGDILGWSAIVKPYVYSLGAVASADTRLLKFSGKNLRVLLEIRPEQGYILMRNIAQTMASRVSVLSEQVPSVGWRLLLSTVLSVLGIVTGLVLLVLGIPTLLAAFNGSSAATQAVPVALFCLIFPLGFLFLARQLAGRNERKPAEHSAMQ